MVQTIGNGKGLTQRSSGAPGTAESGDRMGTSLAGSPATGATKPLIGIPGEDSSTGAVLVGLPIGGGLGQLPEGQQDRRPVRVHRRSLITGRSASVAARAATDAESVRVDDQTGTAAFSSRITP